MAGQTLATRSLGPLSNIPLAGFINGIAVGPKARFCVVVAGQEPRLGRWDRFSGAKNRFGIVRLRHGNDDDGICNEEDREDPNTKGSGCSGNSQVFED